MSLDHPLPRRLDPRRGARHLHEGRRDSWRSTALRITMAVATVLSITAFGAAGYAWYQYRDLNNGITRVTLHHEAASPVQGAADNAGTGADQNILLVGNDDRSKMTDAEVSALHLGRDGGSSATDTMMVLHVPADGQRATLISMPRDSYVAIPGHGMNRLNSAYVTGYNSVPSSASTLTKQAAGTDLLIRSVQNLTGLTIDHYVQVSLLGFYEISKAIGGIDVTMCTAVDDTHAHNVATGQDGGSGFHVRAGHQHLTAIQTLEFVRQRHNLAHGDLDRVKRQQYFLTAAFRKVAGIGLLSELSALKSAIQRNVVIDGDLDLIKLAQQMENLSANNIVGRTIPIDGDNRNSPVGDVLVVSPTHVRAFVHTLLYPTPAVPSSSHTTAHPSTSPTRRTPAAIDAHCIY